MTRYLGRRLAQAVLVLFGLVTAVFFVTQVLGDPVRLMLPQEAPLHVVEEMRQAMGYNDPVPVQYARFMARAITGDFGVSVWQRVPVLPLVLGRLPATMMLAFTTIAVAVLVAVPAGMLSAVKADSALDRLITVASLTGVCIPVFWFALMLILVFAVTLRWLPTSGYGGWQYLVLPVLALVVYLIGRTTQLVRSSMLDELSRPYMTAARAKGLAESRIVFVHALKNAAVPVVTLIAGDLLGLLNGTIVVETIFAWPGLGMLTIESILKRDLPLLQGTVVVYAIMVVGVNLLVDLFYAFLDPRIRFGPGVSSPR